MATSHPLFGLSLSAAADIAQIVFAITAVGALIYAHQQLRQGRAIACRDRAYDYADLFSRRDMLEAIAAYKEFWTEHTFADFVKCPTKQRVELNAVANVIEDVAWLYNRGLVDQDVTAELLGASIESLWAVSESGIEERRKERENQRLYVEWDEMRKRTPKRRWDANEDFEKKRFGERLPMPVAPSPPARPHT